VFARGHEVPWAFKALHWGVPWSSLYLIAEPPEKLLALHRRIVEHADDPETRELARSLAFNRHPSLAFTRDRLLFFVQQQRMARRSGARRSDFAFECNYFLNHYYLLLWGGLEQICLIVNDVCGVGFERRRVGIANSEFLGALSGTPVYAILTDAAFVAWRKMLASARHLAAHRGITMASELRIRSGEEPTDAEVDTAVEASDDWNANVAAFGSAGAEQFRDLLRFQERVRRMERFPERVLPVEIDGETCLIMPLINIEYDFEQFMTLASRVANELLRLLEGLGQAAGTPPTT
jgi:hypothetical protein